MTYPEHEKLAKVSDVSQAIGEFLEWMEGQGIQRMHYEGVSVWYPCSNWRCGDDYYLDENDVLTPVPKGMVFVSHKQLALCDECNGEEGHEGFTETWIHDHRTIELLLAEYFDIDLKKIEEEKRAMLDSIRQSYVVAEQNRDSLSVLQQETK